MPQRHSSGVSEWVRPMWTRPTVAATKYENGIADAISFLPTPCATVEHNSHLQGQPLEVPGARL
jgi:hypothetical protein